MTRTVGLTLLTRIAVVASGFAISIISARYIGPHGRGQYFFVITLAALIVQFGNLGLHASNTYRVAGDRLLLGPLLANSLWTAVLIGSATAAVVVVVTGLTGTSTPWGTLSFAIGLAPPLLFWLLGTSLLVGIGRIGLFNVLEAGSRVAALVLSLLVGIAGFGVNGFLGAYLAASLGAATLLLVLLLRTTGGHPHRSYTIFSEGLRYATKAYLIAILGFLLLRSNVFLLEHIKGSTEVGYFSVAAQVADVIVLVPASIALVLFPTLVREQLGAWRSTVRAALVCGAVVLVVCAVTGLFASPFVKTAFGSEFEPATEALWWLLPGVVAVSVTTVLSQFLASVGMPRALVGVWFIGVVAVLSGGLALIPGDGATGAAVSTSIAQVLVLFLVLALCLRYRAAAGKMAVLAPSEVPG